MKLHAEHHDGTPGPIAIKTPTIRDMDGNWWRREAAGADIYIPDPDVVAATEPCPTCEGVGWVDGIGECPNCIGGKPTVELTYDCPTMGDTHMGSPGAGTGGCEYDCGNTGIVSAGVGTIQLVRVLGDDESAKLGEHQFVFRVNDRWVLCDLSSGSARTTNIILPSKTKPGDTVIVWTPEADR